MKFSDGKTLRLIVMISTEQSAEATPGRQSPEERKAAVEAVVRSAERAVPEIDATIAQHGGRRISGRPDALGCIIVETNAQGMEALQSLNAVAGVVEDQPIELIR